MDPEEDSDNSSVYVQGLGDNVTLEDLADFFKQCGVVKVRRNTLPRVGKGLPAPPCPDTACPRFRGAVTQGDICCPPR